MVVHGHSHCSFRNGVEAFDDDDDVSQKNYVTVAEYLG